MAHLVDTSVLARLANAADSRFALASHAVSELHRRGETLHITAQNLVEFRNMHTRPTALNGLGLSTVREESLASLYAARFPPLPETPDIYPAWKALVQSLGVIGKQVHDARLVAVCHVHHVSHLLTFNVGHFTRLAGFGPKVTVVDPASV
jgi:predicted nucleic acid-binding protein